MTTMRDKLIEIEKEIISVDIDLNKLCERMRLLEDHRRDVIVEIINAEQLLSGLTFCYQDINETYTLFRRHVNEREVIIDFFSGSSGILYLEPEIHLYRSEYDLFLQFETKVPPSYVAKKYGIIFDTSSIAEKKKELLLQVLGLDQIMDMVKK